MPKYVSPQTVDLRRTQPEPRTMKVGKPWGIGKDENIGIDGNIECQKYGNISGNIGEISILIKL